MIRRALHSLLGSLSLEERVERLNPTAWFDATETYAKSKIAVDLVTTDPDYLETNGISLDSGSFSISAWVYIDLGGVQRICSSSDGSANSQFIFGINGSGRLSLYVCDGDLSNFIGREVTSAPITAAWKHVVVTYDGGTSATGINLYIDGSLQTMADLSGGTYSARDVLNEFQIGRFLGDGVAGASGYDGKIDQLVVFNKELDETTDGEITALFDPLGTGVNKGLNHKDLDGTETFYNNIVAWYDFNVPKNFGRNYAEESHAVRLVSPADSLSIANADAGDFSFDYNQPFSVVGWIKFNSGSSDTATLAAKGDGSTIGWHFWTGTRSTQRVIQARFVDSGGNRHFIHANTTDLQDEVWYHVACCYNGGGETSDWSFFVNGSPEGRTDLVAETLSTTATNTNDFVISGSSPASGASIDYDEIAIYNADISASISTLYNGGVVAEASTLHTDNLVSSWSFNEQDPALIGGDVYGSNDLTPNSIVEADLVGGKDSLDLTEVSITSANTATGHIEGKAAGFDGVTNWTDRSGNGNDLTQDTLADVPSWLANQANGFGGVDFTNTAFLKSANTLNMDGYAVTAPVSFFFAFRVTDVTTVQYFYINGAQLRVGISAGRFWLIVYDDTVDNISRQASVSVLNIDTLHTIAVTYDGTGATNGDSAIKLYLDGAEITGASYITSGVFNGNYGASGYSYDSWFADAGGSNPVLGDVYQGLFFEDRLLEDSEVQTIHDFCAEKYGL